MGLRDRILNKKDIKETPDYKIPEWEETVLLRGLTGRQRARILSACTDKAGNVNYEKMFPSLVIAGVYDQETGKPAFEDADRDALNEKAGAVVERIAMEVMNLSGMNEKSAEEAAKN